MIKMAVNRKGGSYVHGTKFMNLFRYILIKFYAAGRMKSNCDKLTHSRITHLIIKITIFSVLIGLKKAYFPLIRLPSCYRTVCYWIVCYWTVCYWTVCYRTVQKANHIQRCSLKQPITFKVVITYACTCACFCVFAFFFVLLLYFNANFPLFSQLGYFSRKL